MMSLFSSISWADFLITAIILLLLFNIAVVVYYQAFYKGDEQQNTSEINKFTPVEGDNDNDDLTSEDEQEVMFVSMDDDEENAIDEEDLSVIPQEEKKDENFTNEIEDNPEEHIDEPDEIDEQAILAGVDESVFFEDGQPLTDEDYELAEQAFSELGFTGEELSENVETYEDNDDLISAAIQSINVDASELEKDEQDFLEISQQLADIQEKEQQEEIEQLQASEGNVSDNFFGEQNI